MAEDNMTLGYLMGQEGNNNGGGFMNSEGMWIIVILAMLVPGLYACGEVLDIDGDCGGYNLQWAWSSGRLAGVSAGGKI